MFEARILSDSISQTGKRLTTFEATFPRIVLAEFNTHRAFSRNSASSRAIPFLKQLSWVISDPFIPARFPKNTKGMQPAEYYELGTFEYELASKVWLNARDSAIEHAKRLTGDLPAALIPSGSDLVSDTEVFLNVHKQIANRLIEPFLFHKVIVTASEWSNFFKLRTHSDAQDEIRTIADLLYDLYYREDAPCPEGLKGCEVYHGTYTPQILDKDQWHLPLLYTEDKILIERMYNDGELASVHSNPSLAVLEFFKQVSVARCARVSYLTHEGKRDILKDLELYTRLHTSGHWSPFEHVACPAFYVKDGYYVNEQHGNFVGWKQHRKEFPNENAINFRKEVSFY
jgi:Predicted alternative thymidylate synthase